MQPLASSNAIFALSCGVNLSLRTREEEVSVYVCVFCAQAMVQT